MSIFTHRVCIETALFSNGCVVYQQVVNWAAVWLLVLMAVVVLTTFLVTVDSSRIGARRGLRPGHISDMGPTGWFFSCLLLWIIAVPVYLGSRDGIKAAATTQPAQPATKLSARERYPAATAVSGSETATALVDIGPPSPGWYADPSVPGQRRWWEGKGWGPADVPGSISETKTG